MSKNATFFKDLNKEGNDIIEKEFPTTSVSVEATSKAPNVTFKTTAARKTDGAVSGSVEPSYEYKDKGVNFKATLKTDGSKTCEFSHSDKLVDGLKATLTGENQGEKNSIKGAVDYKNSKFGTFTGFFLYPFKSAPASLGATFTAGYEGFTAGGSVDGTLGDKPALSKYSARLLYNHEKFTFGGYFNAKHTEAENIAGLHYHHKVRSDVELAGDISADTGKLGDTPKLKFGLLWRKDANTTLKSKVESDSSKLSFSLTQKLSDSTTVVLGSETNLANVNTSSAGHKVGATIKLNF